MAKTLAVFGCIAIAVICMLAYTPIHDRMMQEDFQELSYGPTIANALPALLGFFAVVFSAITAVVASNIEWGD